MSGVRNVKCEKISTAGQNFWVLLNKRKISGDV